jgi:hypothetical protein
VTDIYGSLDLTRPTKYFSRCGAWTDPKPVLVPVDVNDRSKGFTMESDDPVLAFPQALFKNAQEFFDGWKQTEMPFMDDYKIIIVPDLDAEGKPNFCYKTATKIGLTAVSSLLSALALFAF